MSCKDRPVIWVHEIRKGRSHFLWREGISLPSLWRLDCEREGIGEVSRKDAIGVLRFVYDFHEVALDRRRNRGPVGRRQFVVPGPNLERLNLGQREVSPTVLPVAGTSFLAGSYQVRGDAIGPLFLQQRFKELVQCLSLGGFGALDSLAGEDLCLQLSKELQACRLGFKMAVNVNQDLGLRVWIVPLHPPPTRQAAGCPLLHGAFAPYRTLSAQVGSS